MLITFACPHWCQNIVGNHWNFILFWAAIGVGEWFAVNVSNQVAVMMSYRIQPYMLVYSDFLTSNHVSGFEEQTMSWTVLALYKRLWIALQFGVHKMYYRELALHHHQNHCNLDYLISIPGSRSQLLKHIVTFLVMNNHLQLWVRSHSWFSSSETNFLLRSSAGFTMASRDPSHSDNLFVGTADKTTSRNIAEVQ